MRKLWMMFTFLSLAVAGYCASGQAGSEVNADAQQQTVYICVVTSSSGTEVIATRVNGDYNAQVAVASEVSFDYSSESHQTGYVYYIPQGSSSSGRIEGSNYTYGADIEMLRPSQDSQYVYVKGSEINL